MPQAGSYEIEKVQIPVGELLPFINQQRLFRARWGYRRGAASEQEYLELEKTIIRPEFDTLIERLAAEHIADPLAAFRLLPCRRTGEKVKLLGPADTEFSFRRQQRPPFRSLADYFLPESAEQNDLIGLQIVTLGQRIQTEIQELFSRDNYRDYLHLHGLAVELTEAAAEYVQHRMQAALSPAGETVPATRYSFGYPCCPDLSANRTIAGLLHADEMGVEFTEDDQMVPEFTTAAFVLFNPRADYFSL